MNKKSRPSRRRVSVLDASPRVGDLNFGTNDAPWPKGGICWGGRNKMTEEKEVRDINGVYVNIEETYSIYVYVWKIKNMLFRELIYFLGHFAM